ncbi:hypothetical protein SPAR68_2310 [Streptococcus pneumoniae GA41301]|nr:hypothetical protein SPAR68_2310 [Streptococcus pneumoniae GA41301]
MKFVKFISNIFYFTKLAWKRDLERKGFTGKRLPCGSNNTSFG